MSRLKWLGIYKGLDDIAHNRLLHWNRETDKFRKVKNYGKRNKKAKCYCKMIKIYERQGA
jgi:hypothetical protein